MPTAIKPKRSETEGSVPAPGDLETHEIAINLVDGAIFSKDAGGVVREIGLPVTERARIDALETHTHDTADTKFTRIHRPAGAYTTSAADFSGVVVAAGDVTLHFATPADILKPINIKNLSGGAVSVLFATGVSGTGSTTIDDGAALTAIVETADGGAVTYLLI